MIELHLELIVVFMLTHQLKHKSVRQCLHAFCIEIMSTKNVNCNLDTSCQDVGLITMCFSAESMRVTCDVLYCWGD